MYRKKKKRRFKLIWIFFAIIFILSTKFGWKLAKNYFDNQSYSVIDPATATTHSAIEDYANGNNEEERGNKSILKRKIYSSHAILVDLASNKILFSKASSEKTYPASLTKIMTTILAIENINDLQERICLEDRDFKNLYTEHASMGGFVPNEEVKAIDLLYATMLPSGAEAATGLANHISGSQEEFVKLMNRKARKLGMKHTHFTNVTGLQDSNHYTTVKDMAILLKYALNNKTFKEIFTTRRYSTSPTNKNKDGITFKSLMFQNMESGKIDDGEIIGGKTGYTDKAGLCLASLGKKDDREYILITTNAKGNHQTRQYNIIDAMNIYKKYLK